MKLDGLALVLLALLFGAIGPAYPVLVLGSALLVLVLVRARALKVIFLTVLLSVQGSRGCARMKSHAEARATLLALRPSPARCDGVGVVVSSPARAGALRFDVDAEHVKCDESDTEWNGRVRLYLEPSEEDFARGDRIWFIAQLGVPEAYANAAFEHPGLALAARDVSLSGGGLYAHVTAPHGGLLARLDHGVRRFRDS